MIYYYPLCDSEAFNLCCKTLYEKFPYDRMLTENRNDFVKIWHRLININWRSNDKKFVLLSIDSNTKRFHFSPGSFTFLSEKNPKTVQINNGVWDFGMGIHPDLVVSHLTNTTNALPRHNISFYIYSYKAFVEAITCLLKYQFADYDYYKLSVRSCLVKVFSQTNFLSNKIEDLKYIEDFFNHKYDLGDGSGSLKIRLDLRLEPFKNTVSIERVKPEVINGVRQKFVEDKGVILLKEGEVENEFIKVLYKCTYGKYPLEEVTENTRSDSRTKQAADTVLNTMKEGASMGPPSLIMKKIVDCVEDFLLRKGLIKQCMVNNKLWKACRNPLCVGLVYFVLFLMGISEKSRISYIGLTAVQLALKKVSADASESISNDLFNMVEAILMDVEKINF